MRLKKIYIFTTIIFISILNLNILKSDERIDAAIDQIQIISEDLKTLEKAIYKKSDVLNTTSSSNNLNSPVLNKLLLIILTIYVAKFSSPENFIIATLYGSSVPCVISSTSSDKRELAKKTNKNNFFMMD